MRPLHRNALLGLAASALLIGCAGRPAAPAISDAGSPVVDAGPVDAGAPDAGEADAGEADAGSADAGLPDAGAAQCAVPVVSLAHGPEVPGAALEHLLDPAAHPEAVCNDGTPGGYVFRPGVGQGAHRWIIYLEGGGSCFTAGDCQSRNTDTPHYMTSSWLTEGQAYRQTLEGIKSPDPVANPDFYDANLLQLVYCSSDAWSGDVAGSSALPVSDLGHWSFRGRKIVQAVLQDLQTQGLASATEVFLMGSSAGALGVVSNIDDVAGQVPPSARFVALIDAGLFFDYPDYDPATGAESTAAPTHRRADLATVASVWGGRGNATCEAAATSPEEHQLCRGTFDVIHGGFVSAPLFIRQSEYDRIQLKGLTPSGTPSAGYASRFAQAMADHLRQLGPLGNVAVFGSNDTQHGVVNDNAEWNAVTVDGLHLPQTIGDWYRDPCGHMAKHVADP